MYDNIPLTERQIQARASGKSFDRGETLYTYGAISRTVRRGDEINARCRGSYPQPYRVWARILAGEIAATSCDCEYDWGGDCKHIVALLLTYLHHPERFEEAETLRDALMSRQKEDLVDIIEEMILLHPELEDIVEVVAGDGSSNQHLDLQSMRRELRQSLAVTGVWMDRVAENKVYELTRLGSRYARRGDCAHAIAIYCAILQECNANDYPTDDEGQYVEAINNTVEHLKEAVSGFEFAQQEGLRQRVLNVLVDTLIWDIEFGGIDYGYEAEDLLLKIAQLADICRIREHISLIADRESVEERFSNWGAEAYENILMKLDKLVSIEPEETLKRLQAKELHYLYASKLLDLKRYKQAVGIIDEKMKKPHELIRGLDLLRSHDQAETAIQLAEEALGSEYDNRIMEWLIGFYQQQGDRETEFCWQMKRMQIDPHINHYLGLRAVSESLHNWRTVRPQIVAELEKKQAYQVLTLTYLNEKDWNMAWVSLDKVSEPQFHHPSHVIYRLDFTVAEASRQVLPAPAIPVYVKYARAEIALRTRKRYAEAAKLLLEVRGMYRQMNDSASWQTFIADLRQEFARLPALQDELNKAGL
ncbi:MAG: hypothetical protein OXG39_13380 [Chloroflexi bacterium]|nr:hypothetical protein [Chloroflexota bacterium]